MGRRPSKHKAEAIHVGDAAEAVINTAGKRKEKAESREEPLGRPSGFKPEYVEQARKLCSLGATDDELADFFGIHRATLYRWKLDFPNFCDAIKSGKDPADERVERGLYQKSTGYYVTEQQAIKVKTGQYEEKVEVVEVQKYVPPDTTAQIFWLKNRRKDDWRDRKEVEVGGPGDFDRMTDDELRDFIAGPVAGESEGEGGTASAGGSGGLRGKPH